MNNTSIALAYIVHWKCRYCSDNVFDSKSYPTRDEAEAVQQTMNETHSHVCPSWPTFDGKRVPTAELCIYCHAAKATVHSGLRGGMVCQPCCPPVEQRYVDALALLNEIEGRIAGLRQILRPLSIGLEVGHAPNVDHLLDKVSALHRLLHPPAPAPGQTDQRNTTG